jgi:isopentenyldiphosphate isomerase
MKKELVDIVNEKNEVIGKDTRKATYEKGLRHRASHIFLFNSKNEVFLQLRSKKKFWLPGYWGYSVGESLKSGETYEEAAKRGLKEELGIKKEIPIKKIKVYNVFTADKKRNLVNKEISCLFKAKFDGKIKLNKKELDDGRFFSKKEIEVMLKNGTKFGPTTRKELIKLIKEGLWK